MYKKFGISAVSVAAVLAAAPVSNAATVLTLEGGFVGMQHIFHFTPSQLRGDLCDAPNNCTPVDYFAMPGDKFNEQGATDVQDAIDALSDDEPVILFGHSQGGQVIYTDLRRWAADPASAPDPSRLTWVSIGNPENPYGGHRAAPDSTRGFDAWLPVDTAYEGIEVIRQYDGWADAPDDKSNFLAVANAVIGMFTIHSNYRDIDLNDPNNVRFTPDLPDGSPGNITYVWVPTDVLPLAKLAGPFAPMVDNMLRPMIEAAYDRPVTIADPTPPAAAAVSTSKASIAAAAAAVPSDAPASAPDSVKTSESVADQQNSAARAGKTNHVAKAPTNTRSPAASSGKTVGHHRSAQANTGETNDSE